MRKNQLVDLIQAKDKFGDTDELRKRGRFYLALFLFQQSAEKALKAYLYQGLESVEILRTHSVAELAHMAQEIEDRFRAKIPAKKLDQYYLPTRCTNGLPGGVPSRYFDDPEEAKEAVELAPAAIETAEKALGERGTAWPNRY
ncbi:MAG: HEPN domain-containing protein [Bacillota bacterium]